VFAALTVPNFRLYFAGQAVSLVGTWMQVVAQSWLVLQLTGSGTLLGLVAAAQFLPVLLLGPYGGLIADRADKRRLLMGTQSALGLLALLLGLLTVTHQPPGNAASCARACVMSAARRACWSRC
jgi:MFS family permease